MPHLDHPAIFANVLSDFKIGKFNDMYFVRAAKDILKPSCMRVYDSANGFAISDTVSSHDIDSTARRQ